MNAERLLQKLLAAARRESPSETVPYAFEKRVMARLSGKAAPDLWAAWGRLLWWAVAPCCALMLIAGGSSMIVQTSSEDLGAQLEAVLLADLVPVNPEAP